MNIKRGDIFYTDLRPVVGSEQGGLRPVVVIQNDIGNRFSPTTIIAPLTTRTRLGIPTHTHLYFNGKANTVLAEQLRTISKTRLLYCLGQLNKTDVQKLDNSLKIALNLDKAMPFQAAATQSITRGDLFHADLGAAVGSEQNGKQWVVVLQNDMGNLHSPTTIVAVVTPQSKRYLPTHVTVTLGQKPNTVVLEQLRAISVSRLGKRMGHLDEDILKKINAGLMLSLDINGKMTFRQKELLYKHQQRALSLNFSV